MGCAPRPPLSALFLIPTTPPMMDPLPVFQAPSDVISGPGEGVWTAFNYSEHRFGETGTEDGYASGTIPMPPERGTRGLAELRTRPDLFTREVIWELSVRLRRAIVGTFGGPRDLPRPIL